MAPIRRYLRISKASVLEVRIYLHKPSDVAWLLSSRDPVLPRIIEAVRPKVLPKLREENENAKKKKGAKKRRAVKDVASEEDFEVSIYFRDTSTRHSLLTKQKQFSDKPKLKSTGSKLTGWLNTSDNPIHVQDDDGVPAVLQESDADDDVLELSAIPEASKKRKSPPADGQEDEDEGLFVSSSDEEFFQTQRERRAKRRKRSKSDDQPPVPEAGEPDDDKKKLAMDTSYNGFTIWGRILCLIVTRKGRKDAPRDVPYGGSQMMEQWVSTQAVQDEGFDGDDNG